MQETAYERRSSDWSSDVCSSDLRDLVGAGQQQLVNVLDAAHAATDGERHEAALGGAAHDVEQDAPVLVACRDVATAELVGAGGIVSSAERRVGNECVSTCSSRWLAYH